MHFASFDLSITSSSFSNLALLKNNDGLYYESAMNKAIFNLLHVNYLDSNKSVSIFHGENQFSFVYGEMLHMTVANSMPDEDYEGEVFFTDFWVDSIVLLAFLIVLIVKTVYSL